MHNFLIALVIGIIAGIIDATPMFVMKMERSACISAFFHYLILGLIIPFVSWNIDPWLKGLIIAELSAIPIMIIVFPKDKKALIPMTLFAAVLGIGIALAGAKFIV